MRFRLLALLWHLLASAVALALTLGTLYLGWYRWPGWYLANVIGVFGVMTSVDLALGPLLTFAIASPQKSRSTLARDVAVIATIQVIALAYGTVTLWNGRPLYYAFSENCLSLVQAYDIEPEDLNLARRLKAPLVPRWYSLPRWIWAPLPEDPKTSGDIVTSAIQGGSDVTAMPRYYKNWNEGLANLRMQLKKVDDIKFFNGIEKQKLKARMQESGYSADQANGIAITGRSRPALAIFDPASMKISSIFAAT